MLLRLYFYVLGTIIPWWRSCRFGLAFMGFIVFLNLYAHRVSMSVAIVSMVNHTAVRSTLTNNFPRESLLADQTSLELTLTHHRNDSYIYQNINIHMTGVHAPGDINGYNASHALNNDTHISNQNGIFKGKQCSHVLRTHNTSQVVYYHNY